MPDGEFPWISRATARVSQFFPKVSAVGLEERSGYWGGWLFAFMRRWGEMDGGLAGVMPEEYLRLVEHFWLTILSGFTGLSEENGG